MSKDKRPAGRRWSFCILYTCTNRLLNQLFPNFTLKLLFIIFNQKRIAF